MSVRRTKIVATLGPASNSPEVLEQLILAGLDVARLNFSHGTPDEHKARAKLVRDLAASGKGVLLISSEMSELLTACDRILVMADGRAHQMLDRAELDDPAETNPDHALQAAERRLQIEIQKALTAKEATHG